jgi:Secretion system C-terminal sorting domain
MKNSHFIKVVILAAMLILFAGSASALELIVSGDFSDAGTPGGIPGWVTSANPISYNPVTVTGMTQWDASTGSICVAPGNSLGGYNTSWIEQTVHIPRDALGSTLTFYYEWYVRNLMGTQVYADAHFQSELMMREQGDGSFIQFTPTPGWTLVQHYVALEGYSDQDVLIRVRAFDDGIGDPNYIHVDAVSLDVETATKTNTPTITPTYTITKTRTITQTFTYTPTITPTYTVTPTITQTRTVTPWPVPHGDAIAFPNPAKGDQVIFMYSLESAADISVEIYNTLGYKVAHLEDSNKSGAINRRTTWNIRDVAPGVYMYQVVVRGHNGQTQKNKMRRVVIIK